MIFIKDFEISSSKINIDGEITNKGIIEILEDIACKHADSIGDGIKDRGKKQKGWVILDWKIQILKRPKYEQSLNVLTWGRDAKKCYIYRDFEIYDDNNEICVIATSKWVLVSLETGKISRISDKLLKEYDPECGVEVFKDEKLEKIETPKNYETSYTYKVKRRDIDINKHMHNVYYLDIANEALPEDVYNKEKFNNIRIMYKKEIKLNDNIKCKYSKNKEKHVVTIYSEDEKILHAIIELY